MRPHTPWIRHWYIVHLMLTGKRVVDFLLVIMELYLLDVTAKALRVKISIFEETGSV